MEDEKWRLILHSGSRHSLWIIGGQNWCSYAQIASWLPNSQAQLKHIHIVLYFPYISWHQKKMKEMCSTRITFHPFCFNFHFASLAFPLQLYISSVFLEHVFHFHTQYFFPYFFPLSQMIVSIIVALLLRSKGSCSTCSKCTYKSLLMDGGFYCRSMCRWTTNNSSCKTCHQKLQFWWPIYFAHFTLWGVVKLGCFDGAPGRHFLWLWLQAW